MTTLCILGLLAILLVAMVIRSTMRARRADKFWREMDGRLTSGTFDCNDAARIILRDMGAW